MGSSWLKPAYGREAAQGPEFATTAFKLSLCCFSYKLDGFRATVTSPQDRNSLEPMASLTTLFSAPSTCSALITWDGALLWQGGIFQTNDPNCFPTSFASIFGSWYSPGVCPYGWTSAGSVSGTAGLATIPTETNALCCPRGYSVEFNGQPAPGSSGIFCRISYSGLLTNVYSTSTLAEGPAPGRPMLQTVEASELVSAYGWEDVIQVRWQSTDQQVLSLMSIEASQASELTSSPALKATNTASPAPTASSQHATETSRSHTQQTHSVSSGLSPGASAGIGVGVALGTILVAAIGAWGFLRRKSQLRSANVPTNPNATQEQKHYPSDINRGELDSQAQIYEMDARRQQSPLQLRPHSNLYEMST